MNRLLNTLKTKKMSLISSLPWNDYELAKASWEAGADAIKVHVNLWHRASNNTFGTIEDNRETFERIIKDSPVPVGIVLGDDPLVAEKCVDEAVKMGFDFVSLYGHHTPASITQRNDINTFYAVNYSYTHEEVFQVSKGTFADILELSICDPDSYGQRLNARDLMRYQMYAEKSKIPTVVPTQHLVYPEDVKAFAKTGVSAIMVGAISFGKDKDTIYKTLKAFREEIDKLC